MYGALWRRLPGPTWLRLTIVLASVAALIAVCFTWVFPAIAPHMPFVDVTVRD